MAAKVNLIIDQGSTFYQQVQLFDDNDEPLVVTTGTTPIYNAASEMRKSYQASNSISFDTALSNGMLILSLAANTTADIIPGRYVYDVKLAGSNAVSRIVEGIVTVKPEATK